MLSFEFAGLIVSMSCPIWMIEPTMDQFRCDKGPADIQCEVIFEKATHPEFDYSEKITDDGEKAVYHHNQSFYIADHNDILPSSIIASNDWSKIKIFLDPVFNNSTNPDIIFKVQSVFFYLLRSLIQSAVTLFGGVLIHSASLIWDGKGIIFSAPSGTGKTTHVNMWLDKYDVKVLNGDITACRVLDGKSQVYGLPWCGSSGQVINDSAPLGAVVFLEQNENNSITKLTVPEAVIRLYARCYLFVCDEKTADRILDTITSIVTSTDCYLLKCRPDYEAVELVKECLEKA